MSFYVAITLNASNFRGSISAKLNKEINLRGEWEVAIIDTNLAEGEAEFFIFCDLVDYTFINEGLGQLIAIVKSAKSSKMYMRVNKKRFSNINIDVKFDLLKDQPSIILSDSYFILHFKKL